MSSRCGPKRRSPRAASCWWSATAPACCSSCRPRAGWRNRNSHQLIINKGSLAMDAIVSVAAPILIVLVVIVGIGMTVARLYRRAEKDRAYVRTGLGGQKIILDGGSVVLPVFQSINWVNLQTLRLDVRRDNAEAMITKDRMRVDIGVEFYVRVKPDHSSIALAAQTLGDRTNDAVQLRELVEAKFVDPPGGGAAAIRLGGLR